MERKRLEDFLNIPSCQTPIMSNIQNPSCGFPKAKQVHAHHSFLHKEHEQEEEEEDDDEDEGEIMFDMSSSRSRHSYSRFSACFQGFTKRAPKQNYSGGGLSSKSNSEKLENNIINAVKKKKKAMLSMRSAKASVSSVTERYKKVDHHHWDSDAEDESLIGEHDNGTGSSIGKVETSEGSKFSRESDKKKKISPSGKIFESCRRLFFGF